MTYPPVGLETAHDPEAPLHGIPHAGRECRLTPQETQVLALLVRGHYKKTAADVLGISVNTVSFHLKNIYTKLQVHSKTEAVVKALMEGLVPMPN